MWPVIAEGYTPSVLRFQGNACAAYGAQGVWWFTYNRRMRAFFYETAREVNTYLSQTAGPHLLGHRSIGVFHTGPDIPRNALPPAAGELIEAMPEEMLVGVLVPESSFKAGDFTPDGIFVVDKRTAKYRQFKPIDEWCTKQRDEGGVRARHKLPPEIEGYHREMYAEDPPPRSVTIRFGPRIKKVTAVLPNGRLKPCSLNENNEAVMPPLRGGEGVLLKVDAQQLEVLELPRARIQRLGLEWRFATDENKVGTEQKWFSPAFDDSAWAIAREDSHRGWETATGKRYEGDGWCRQIVEIPASLDAKHLYLHFGSVDEECWVYVNGTLVLENTCKALGIDRGAIWTRPFAVDIRSHVQIGGPNLIALRVYNAYGIGGVLLPVHMVASDEPLTAEQITTIVQ